MELEIILILVIVGVLVVDLIINARKKSSVDESVKKISSTEESKFKSKFSFNFITKRKRNIVSFVILVHILKICIHYFIYTVKNPAYRAGGRRWIGTPKPDEYFDFSRHLDNIYVWDVDLFIPSFIILSIFVWLINDKIKAR